MTLRTRLFLLIGGVAAVTIVAATWLVSATARRSFAILDAERTSALVTQTRREFDREGTQVTDRVGRIAATDAVARIAAALARSRVEAAAYVNDASSLAAAHGLDVLELVASDGTIVSSAHWPARFGYRENWVASAPRDRAFLQAIELPRDRALALIAVTTVPAAPNALLVIGGRRIDAAFLRSLPLPAGMRVWLYRNVDPEIVGSNLVDASGTVAAAALLDPLIARTRDSASDATETIAWGDGPETVVAAPLKGSQGHVAAVLLVGSSGRELVALLSRIRWTGIAAGALAIVAAFALSYVAASGVTRPVEELARGARAVAAGDWSVRLDPVGATGEIAELAQAFEMMTTQLADQRERLLQAERVAAWRELARRLAHELKNPLFPLRLTVDNLRRAKALPGAEFDEVFDESLDTLGQGLTNLTTVIGRFSDFSTMPAPHVERVSANDLVENAVRLFRAQIDAPDRPHIEVTLDLDPSAPAILVDPEQLGRALQNLVLNAIDAMPRGGCLAVQTAAADGRVRIKVSDTGEGLTDEERTRLFTPYYTTKAHGTGLGLAIVQAVVADHHGRVAVDSLPRRGTTFAIELALAPPERSS